MPMEDKRETRMLREMHAVIRKCYEKTRGMELCSIEESDEYFEAMEELMKLEAKHRGEELERKPPCE